MSRKIYKPWVKLHIRLLRNADIGELPDSSKWRFIECLLLAGEERNRALEEGRDDEDGYLPSLKYMAYTIRTTQNALRDDLSRLSMAGLIEIRPHSSGEERWFVTNFAKWQEPTPPAERKRIQRKIQKAQEEEKEEEKEERGRIRIIDVPKMSRRSHENVTSPSPHLSPPVIRHEPADRTPGGNGWKLPDEPPVRKPATAEDRAVAEMSAALTEVTGISARINWKKGFGEFTEALVASGYTADQVRRHYSIQPTVGAWNWYEADWRGKKGDKPRLNEIGETIAGATAAAAPAKKKLSQIELALAQFGPAANQGG